ncbi:hypothetical protein AV530_005870 [Patagioenas fasciata monilis]|uniref:Uncharacterized protein n=1 Tax=Patagioenas fasciata monilis TaxID=372326 RepID=A0A1V4JMX4_PATFA|nr:hypothetical protein AV530_005870 [Patagioenas fasciata monilis]
MLSLTGKQAVDLQKAAVTSGGYREPEEIQEQSSGREIEESDARTFFPADRQGYRWCHFIVLKGAFSSGRDNLTS